MQKQMLNVSTSFNSGLWLSVVICFLWCFGLYELSGGLPV